MITKQLKSYFQNNFDSEPSLLKSPGRVNIIGEHTDYNLGLVLPFPIQYAIYYAFSERSDGIFEIHGLDLNKKAKFHKDHLPENHKWLRYFISALKTLKERYSLKGANIVLKADLHMGAGISSSSALTCGFISCLNHINQWNLEGQKIVELSSIAENGTGLMGGIMDQSAITLGKKDYAFFLDCLDKHHEHIPIPKTELQWILLVSGVHHSLVDTGYNDRRQTCEKALEKINIRNPMIRTLRDLNSNFESEYGSLLNEIECKRLRHVIKENERVEQTVALLKQNKLEEIGPLLKDSHHSLRYQYEVSCKEIDFIIDQLAGNKQCLGARIMGGGFGGSVISLFKAGNLDIEKLKKDYFDKFSIDLEVLNIQSGDGIKILNE